MPFVRRYHSRSGTLDLEMPRALPEIAPSPQYDPFVDFRERAMFMQAWSSYGIKWPVISDFLGIRPDAPSGSLSVQDLKVGGGTMEAALRGDLIRPQDDRYDAARAVFNDMVDRRPP